MTIPQNRQAGQNGQAGQVSSIERAMRAMPPAAPLAGAPRFTVPPVPKFFDEADAPDGSGAAAPLAPTPLPSSPLPSVPVEPAPIPRDSQPEASQPSPQPSFRAPPSRRDQAVHRIDRARLARAGMVRPEGGASAQLEEFRIVKRQLLEQAAERMRLAGNPRTGAEHLRRMMVTSPHPGEGKTFCAVNLALSIAAERDREVLLVDCDLARASVFDQLGLKPGPGLMDALTDPGADVLDYVMATDIPRLSVLAGGTPTDSDAEYLASARTAHLLDRLTEGAPNRIVLFDTPPVLAASITVELAKLMGQIVLVVRADMTPQGAIEDAVSLLSASRPMEASSEACPYVQLLLNAVRFSPSGRRFGSYYGYRG